MPRDGLGFYRPDMSAFLAPRLDEFERRLRLLEMELLALRALAAEPQQVDAPPPKPATRQLVERPHVESTPEPIVGREPLFDLPDLSNVDLFGAKALAIAGGIVTALGIVFFFVLAVNRGWVGPEARIGLGAFAALAAYGAGLELRRRFGETYSSLAAVAA